MIEYRCECGQEYQLKDELAGCAVECYECRRTGTVPAAAPARKIPPLAVKIAAFLLLGVLLFAAYLKISRRKAAPLMESVARIAHVSTGSLWTLTQTERGAAAGQFDSPEAVAVAGDGTLYAADTGNNRVQKFDAKGEFVAEWNGAGENASLFGAYGLALDASGCLYVTDSWNRVVKYGPDGKFILQWGEFSAPYGIATDPSGNIYVAEVLNHRIQKFDSNGKFLTKWGSKGPQDGQLDSPYGICVDNSGIVYVADTRNDWVQKFDAAGKFLGKIGLTESDGRSSYPCGVAVDAEGNLYVADSFRGLLKFNREGKLIGEWPGSALGDGKVGAVRGLALDRSGNLYVADNQNHRVVRLPPETLKAK